MERSESVPELKYNSVTRALGAYVFVGGAISFLGWMFNRVRLTDWDGGGISIQPNATICAMSAGLALLLISFGRRRIAAAVGALVALIGIATIFQYLSGINLGIDTLFMFDRQWGREGVLSPGRMGPPGSISWTLIGSALVFASIGSNKARGLVPTIAFVVGGVASLSVIGYIFGADVLYTLPRLVVDDNRDSAESLAILLKFDGHETAMAHDGGAAIEKVRQWRPGVILLDIGLPVMNGYDVCRRIRQLPDGRNIRVIALTGWGQEQDRLTAKDAGFDAHLVKPVDIIALGRLLGGPKVISPFDLR